MLMVSFVICLNSQFGSQNYEFPWICKIYVIWDFCDNLKNLLMSHVVVMIDLKVKNVKAIKQTGFYPPQSHWLVLNLQIFSMSSNLLWLLRLILKVSIIWASVKGMACSKREIKGGRWYKTKGKPLTKQQMLESPFA